MPATRHLQLSPALALAAALVSAAATPTTPAIAESGDTTADRVLGQTTFTRQDFNMVDARGLAGVAAVAIDTSVIPNRIWVADHNNRVLGWRDEAALRNGAAADVVIGQPDFGSHLLCDFDRSPGAETLCGPTGLAVDAAGNLFVADSINHRVLEYDAPFATDAVADRIFGQAGSFTGIEGCGEGDDLFCFPRDVEIDREGGLWIADTGNGRLLYYAEPLAPGRTPRVLRIEPPPSGCTRELDCGPHHLAFDGAGNLWLVMDERVYGLERPLATDAVVDRVLGERQSCSVPGREDLCRPTGLTADVAGTLWVADSGNSRILVFAAPLATDLTADHVIGQPGFDSSLCNSTGLSARSLCLPGALALDGAGDLWAGDIANFRLLEFQGPRSATVAARVLGQVRFDQPGINLVDRAGLAGPTGVAIDRSVTPNRLWVADGFNHRVLGWRDVSSLRNGQPADLVVGQPGFFRSGCNTGGRSARSLCTAPGQSALMLLRIAVDRRGNLWVADAGNHRVLEFDDPFATDAVADRVIGQPDFASGGCNAGGLSAASLCRPSGLELDRAGNLYVADTDNHRVLRFDRPLTGNAVADAVWGQGGFRTGSCRRGGEVASAENLCRPTDVAIDRLGRLFVVDLGNHRVLGYRGRDTRADLVLGQHGSFTERGCNRLGISAGSLCEPVAVAADLDGDLYVVERRSSRVLEFRDPWRQPPVAARVFGQGGSFLSSELFLGGVSADSLGFPIDAAVDDEGNLYVADGVGSRVLIYDTP